MISAAAGVRFPQQPATMEGARLPKWMLAAPGLPRNNGVRPGPGRYFMRAEPAVGLGRASPGPLDPVAVRKRGCRAGSEPFGVVDAAVVAHPCRTSEDGAGEGDQGCGDQDDGPAIGQGALVDRDPGEAVQV